MKELNREIKELIIRPTLQELNMYSPQAEILILGTGLAESNLRELEQGKGNKKGPALGFWQMEPSTYYDIWKNYIYYRPSLEYKITTICNLYKIPKAEALIWNLKLACCMCRLHYRRIKEEIPNDLESIGGYWKRYYNTDKGKGSVYHFLNAWENR